LKVIVCVITSPSDMTHYTLSAVKENHPKVETF